MTKRGMLSFAMRSISVGSARQAGQICVWTGYLHRAPKRRGHNRPESGFRLRISGRLLRNSERFWGSQMASLGRFHQISI